MRGSTEGVAFDVCEVCNKYDSQRLIHVAGTVFVLSRLAVGECTVPRGSYFDKSLPAAASAAKEVGTEYFAMVADASDERERRRYVQVASELLQVSGVIQDGSEALEECARNQMTVAVQELGLI